VPAPGTHARSGWSAEEHAVRGDGRDSSREEKRTRASPQAPVDRALRSDPLGLSGDQNHRSAGRRQAPVKKLGSSRRVPRPLDPSAAATRAERNREHDDARLPFARETRRGRLTPGAAPSLLRGHRRYRRADAAALRPRGLRTVLPAAGLPARRALPRRLRPALPVRGAGGVRRSSPKRHARDPPLLEPPARARTGGGAASPLSWTGWGRVE
jgi:hypothetical protein